MFKIVATRRRGRVELSTVPASWETRGKLRWPKRNGDVLSKNANVVPQRDWTTSDCILKRSNFLSYEDAEAELNRMLDRTDTEDTDVEERQQAVRSISQHRNFNAMAEFLIDAGNTSTVTENQVIEAHGIDGEVYQLVTQDPQHETVQQASTVKVYDNNDQIKVSNELLIVITQNQEKMMKKLAEISVQLEELNENRSPFVCTLAQGGGTQNEKFVMEPINNVADLERFDNELSDPNIFNKLKEKYSILCSVAEGSGSNCAYRLLDSLFSKEFLCKCSWTGFSRGNEVKIGFKQYKNTIKFFFEMVRYWDIKYSVESNEIFLKSVLRNALKRKDTKNIRKSSKKSKRTTKPINGQDKLGEVDEEETLNSNVANPISTITQNSNDNVEDKTPNNSEASSPNNAVIDNIIQEDKAPKNREASPNSAAIDNIIQKDKAPKNSEASPNSAAIYNIIQEDKAPKNSEASPNSAAIDNIIQEDKAPNNSETSPRHDKLKKNRILNNRESIPSSASTSKLYATDKVAENKTLNFSEANSSRSAKQNINNNDQCKNVSSIKNKTDVCNNPNIVQKRRRMST